MTHSDFPFPHETNIPLSRYTTFQIGGPAEILVKPKSDTEFSEIRDWCRANEVPLTILGGGSNVLIPDEGLRGVTVVTRDMSEIEVLEGCRIRAQAGAKLSKVAEIACAAGMSGLAFASGIPGTVGGAVYMNAGAYGDDISRVCESVVLLGDEGVIKSPAEEMGFGYRKSILVAGKFIALEAIFRLTPGEPAKIREEAAELNLRRKNTQPLAERSAGSTFKRPEGFFAGKLIEDSGLKGFTVGGARVSEKHAGFIINKGNATAKDVLALIEVIRQKVHENFGVWLEPEVRIL